MIVPEPRQFNKTLRVPAFLRRARQYSRKLSSYGGALGETRSNTEQSCINEPFPLLSSTLKEPKIPTHRACRTSSGRSQLIPVWLNPACRRCQRYLLGLVMKVDPEGRVSKIPAQKSNRECCIRARDGWLVNSRSPSSFPARKDIFRRSGIKDHDQADQYQQAAKKSCNGLHFGFLHCRKT
jgi:hypothetical protein